VKQDNCNTNDMGKPEDYYHLMSNALNQTGRPMAFAMCEWGDDRPWEWGPAVAQSWRMHGDHEGVWASTKEIVRASAAIPAANTGTPFGWNDMDMLETGNYGQAAHANGKESTMTATEYRTEFSMWAISASPLVVTTPIMNCSAGYQAPEPPRGSHHAEACKVLMRKQESKATCTKGVSYGCHDGNSTLWVDKGCRGNFVVDGATVLCDPMGPGRHYCGPVSCEATMTDLQKEILLNTEVIAVNQDVTPQGRPVKEGDISVWARKLSGGDIAVALYNENDETAGIGFELASVGAHESVTIRDLWQHKDLGQFTTSFPETHVAAHGTVMLRLKAA